MKNVLATIFAVSMMTAAAPIAMSTSAMAAIVPGSETCGELPNVKWSWSISSVTETSGGGTSTDTTTEFSFSGGTPPNNGWSTTDTIITTEPTYSQTNSVCTALNPAGKVNLDHSTTVEGPLVQTDPGGVETIEGEEVKICDNNNNNNDAGNALPACPLG